MDNFNGDKQKLVSDAQPWMKVQQKNATKFIAHVNIAKYCIHFAYLKVKDLN